MCVAAIGKVIEIKGAKALCSFRGAMKEVAIALVPRVEVGQFVLVHAGFATEIVKDMQSFYQTTVTTDAYASQLLAAIKAKAEGLPQLRIMNFCGSHENTIHQFGIRALLPPNIELLSGPGCPVCVTPESEIYLALELCQKHDVTLTIYGDMLTIPTKWGSLAQAKAQGADVRVVHDINQAVELAKQQSKAVVHYAVGFETTAPSTGVVISAGVENFSVISSHRVTVPAMDYVLKNTSIDALICPGNVGAVIGSRPFEAAWQKYQLPMVITGFEPVDVLEAVLRLLDQILEKSSRVDNQYARVVDPEGNPQALQLMEQVFDLEDATWRGLGVLPKSRLVLKAKYSHCDAEHKFDLRPPEAQQGEPTHCSEVVRGVKHPTDCPHFGKNCTPEDPQGPSMITAEGACRIRL